MRFLLVMYCFVLTIYVTVGSLFPSFRHLNADDTVVEVTLHLPRNRRALARNELLHGFTVRFRMNDDIVVLNLTRIYSDVNMPVYGRQGRDVIKKSSPFLKNRELYHDSTSGACLLVHTSPGTADVIKMFGTFYFGNHQYFIQPHDDHIDDDVDNETLDENHEVLHVVGLAPKVTASNSEPLIGSGRRYREQLRSVKRRQAEIDEYKIELLVVVDHVIYERFFSLTSGTAAQRSNETEALIKQYYAYIIGEMNLRYNSLSEVPYTIQVLAAGIVINKTPAESAWVVNNIIQTSLTSSSVLVNITEAMDDFTAWSAKTTSLPTRDHTMLFTGYNLSAVGNPHSTGIAWISGICSDNSTALVEEKFNFFVATTAAHELGHSLSARHDGDRNPCNSIDNYVMSDSNRISEQPTLTRHLWQFSPCSQIAFTAQINLLNNDGRNCLINQTTQSNLPDTSTVGYSPDDTCVYEQGVGSYMCRSFQRLDQICTDLLCKKPGTSDCIYTLAPEGTSCGSGKWCNSGYCVTSPDAPVIDESCPFGDQPGIIKDGLTCKQLIASRPDYCYQNLYPYFSSCCRSCLDIANHSDPDCIYGDKNVTACPLISRISCYNNEKVCCSTCAAMKDSTRPGCEFGNKALGCTATSCSENCCEACFNSPSTSSTLSTSTAQPISTTQSTSTTLSTAQPTSTTQSTSTTLSTAQPTSTTQSTSTTPSTSTAQPTSTTQSASTTPSTSTAQPISTTQSTSTTPSTSTAQPISTTQSTATIPSALTTKPTLTTQSTLTSNSMNMSTKLDTATQSTTSKTQPTSSSVPDAVYIGVGVGGGLILLIVLVAIVCMMRRRQNASKTSDQEKSADEGVHDNNMGLPGISVTSYFSSHSPPREGSTHLSNGSSKDIADSSLVNPTKLNPSKYPSPRRKSAPLLNFSSKDNTDALSVNPTTLHPSSNPPLRKERRQDSPGKSRGNTDSSPVNPKRLYTSKNPQHRKRSATGTSRDNVDNSPVNPTMLYPPNHPSPRRGSAPLLSDSFRDYVDNSPVNPTMLYPPNHPSPRRGSAPLLSDSFRDYKDYLPVNQTTLYPSKNPQSRRGSGHVITSNSRENIHSLPENPAMLYPPNYSSSRRASAPLLSNSFKDYNGPEEMSSNSKPPPRRASTQISSDNAGVSSNTNLPSWIGQLDKMILENKKYMYNRVYKNGDRTPKHGSHINN